LILRSLLRLNPNVPHGEVQLFPTLPERWLPLRVEKIPVAGKRFDITLDEDGDMEITGLPAELRVVTTRHQTRGGRIETRNHKSGH
jgi:hypothetical protein